VASGPDGKEGLLLTGTPHPRPKEEALSVEFPRHLALASVLGLLLGFALGGLANAYPAPAWDAVAAVAGPVGQAWIRALLLVVVPLIVCYLILAAAGESIRHAAKVGGASLLIFTGMMVAAAAFTLALAPPLLERTPGDLESFSQALAEMDQLGIVPDPVAEVSVGWGDRLVAMIPANLFEAAANGDLIGLILVSVVFGLAVSRIGPQRDSILRLVRAMRDAVFVVTYWVILAIPVGAFALAFEIASRTGVVLAGVIGYYLVVHLGLLIGLFLLLYPITHLVGGGGMGVFARAVWPAQGVAMSTRSSLASLPALMKGARDHLRLPDEVVGMSLPLAASTFKMNTLVSAMFKFLFLARLYGIEPGFSYILLFAGPQILLSPGVPGIPSGGYVMTFPLYVAVGIPLEGVILLKAMDGIPDIFKTLLNTTAYMSAAVFVGRTRGWKPPEG
jgi:Na+/H+-dicarboxylate symporter